jgi:hypothetical protein
MNPMIDEERFQLERLHPNRYSRNHLLLVEPT